jgi:hypothetical protein
VFVWGHGALAPFCIQARVPDVAGVILSGTAIGPFDYEWEDEFAPHQWADSLVHGYIDAESYEPSVRAGQQISIDLLNNVSSFDSSTLLHDFASPILIINGDDPESLEPERFAINKQIASQLPRGSEIAVIAGADHTFKGHFDELGAVSLKWIARHLA